MKYKLAGLIIAAALSALLLIGCGDSTEDTTHEVYQPSPTTTTQIVTYKNDTFDKEKKSKLTSGYWYQKGNSTVTAIKFNEGGSVEFTTYSSAAINGESSSDSGKFFGSYNATTDRITIISERSSEPLIYKFDAEKGTLIYAADNISLAHYSELTIENARAAF